MQCDWSGNSSQWDSKVVEPSGLISSAPVVSQDGTRLMVTILSALSGVLGPGLALACLFMGVVCIVMCAGHSLDDVLGEHTRTGFIFAWTRIYYQSSCVTFHGYVEFVLVVMFESRVAQCFHSLLLFLFPFPYPSFCFLKW